MKKQEARRWWKQVQEHVEVKLKDAVREALQQYWPESDTYDPDVAPKGRELYRRFQKEVKEALARVSP